jgi:hypothetical protein
LAIAVAPDPCAFTLPNFGPLRGGPLVPEAVKLFDDSTKAELYRYDIYNLNDELKRGAAEHSDQAKGDGAAKARH